GKARFSSVELVTGNYFAGIGAQAALGRAIGPGDAAPTASPAAVISYAYWRIAFAQDPAAVGSSISIGGVPFTVVGVAPRGFFGESVSLPPDVWIPIGTLTLLNPTDPRLTSSTMLWLNGMARLKPDLAEAQAQANLDVLLPVLRDKMGIQETANPGLTRIELIPGAGGISELREQYSLPLQVLMTIVGAVLLIACANLANLLL